MDLILISIWTRLKYQGGDYNPSQLSHVCDRPELINQLCTNWFDLGYQRATIAFAVGINHAENIAKAFNERGVKAAIVTGKTPISARNKLYQKLASGELKVLASCSALSEGFDVPKVSCVILARPTKSKALYFQQLGRGLRLAEDKQDCLVLDQSKNVKDSCDIYKQYLSKIAQRLNKDQTWIERYLYLKFGN